SAQGWRTEQATDSLPDIARYQEEYFAKSGKRRTGYRQYMRWQSWIMPRAYPDGDLLNTTSLTWLNHYRAGRSPDVLARNTSAVTAGIGGGGWRAGARAERKRGGGGARRPQRGPV